MAAIVSFSHRTDSTAAVVSFSSPSKCDICSRRVCTFLSLACKDSFKLFISSAMTECSPDRASYMSTCSRRPRCSFSMVSNCSLSSAFSSRDSLNVWRTSSTFSFCATKAVSNERVFSSIDTAWAANISESFFSDSFLTVSSSASSRPRSSSTTCSLFLMSSNFSLCTCNSECSISCFWLSNWIMRASYSTFNFSTVLFASLLTSFTRSSSLAAAAFLYASNSFIMEAFSVSTVAKVFFVAVNSPWRSIASFWSVSSFDFNLSSSILFAFIYELNSDCFDSSRSVYFCSKFALRDKIAFAWTDWSSSASLNRFTCTVSWPFSSSDSSRVSFSRSKSLVFSRIFKVASARSSLNNFFSAADDCFKSSFSFSTVWSFNLSTLSSSARAARFANASVFSVCNKCIVWSFWTPRLWITSSFSAHKRLSLSSCSVPAFAAPWFSNIMSALRLSISMFFSSSWAWRFFTPSVPLFCNRASRSIFISMWLFWRVLTCSSLSINAFFVWLNLASNCFAFPARACLLSFTSASIFCNFSTSSRATDPSLSAPSLEFSSFIIIILALKLAINIFFSSISAFRPCAVATENSAFPALFFFNASFCAFKALYREFNSFNIFLNFSELPGCSTEWFVAPDSSCGFWFVVLPILAFKSFA